MADVILFHHALGRTAGVTAFADRLRAAGHRVTTPDLYDGRVFDTLDAGVAHADQLGMPEVIRRGTAAVADLPAAVVYAGFSLGSMPAQKLAQTRPGAVGAILYHGGVPPAEFGTDWPAGVPLQVHTAERDPWNELAVVRQLTDAVPGGELFVYPGAAHLIAEPASDEYDPAAAELIAERTVRFLSRWP